VKYQIESVSPWLVLVIAGVEEDLLPKHEEEEEEATCSCKFMRRTRDGGDCVMFVCQFPTAWHSSRLPWAYKSLAHIPLPKSLHPYFRVSSSYCLASLHSHLKMNLYQRSNDALSINPPVGDVQLTTSGSDWLWAVTALYSVSLLIVVGLAYFARSGEKIFHYLFTISLFVGAISYFTMASDLGSVAIVTSTNEHGTRQIFYVKFINW